jgi:hypothetical protein
MPDHSMMNPMLYVDQHGDPLARYYQAKGNSITRLASAMQALEAGDDWNSIIDGLEERQLVRPKST